MSLALLSDPHPGADNIHVALDYAAAGIPVIPCREVAMLDADGKVVKAVKGAYISDWPNAGSTNELQIRKWWKEHPYALVGIPCGAAGLFAIDCDVKNKDADGEPINGISNYVEIASKLGINPNHAATVRTPSGGMHNIFEMPESSAMPDGKLPGNSTYREKGIDTRGVGGLVIAAGSVMPDGTRWAADGPSLIALRKGGKLPVMPLGLPVAVSKSKGAGKPLDAPAAVPGPPPSAAAQVPRSPPTQREFDYAAQALDSECAAVAACQEGGRNDRLNTAAHSAATMIGPGWTDRPTVEAALFAAAGTSGIGDVEAAKTIRSGIEAGILKPRGPLAATGPALVAGMADTVDRMAAAAHGATSLATPALDGEQATNQASIQPIANPYTPPPGLMGEIAKYIYDAAPRQVPEIALAGAIGWMAGFAGRAYNINGAGLNLYIAMLASSGSGKEAISNGFAALLDSILPKVPSAAHFVGPADFASPQAVLKFVAKAEHCAVSVVGEFGNWLNQMTGERQNPIRGAIKSVLMEMYGKSGKRGVYRQTVYSDKENNINEIRAPAFSLVGESTPSTFYRNISDASIEDGFLPRFIIIEYEGENKYLNPDAQYAVVPEWLAEKLAMFATICLDLNSPVIGGTSLLPRGPKDVMCDAAAQSRLNELSRVYTDNANAAHSEGLKNLWSRVWLNIAKLAALVAVGCDMGSPIISLDHVTWAENLVTHSVNKIIAKIESGEVAGSDEAKQWQALVKALREVSSYDAARASAYTMNPQMVKARVINTKWLNQRVSKLAIFQGDRHGPTAAVKRVLERALAEELLLRCDFPERVSGGGCTYQIR